MGKGAKYSNDQGKKELDNIGGICWNEKEKL